VLSFESARRYLDARDIDGVVIGDGFSASAVQAFLDTLRADARFRDLPIVVADSRIANVDFDSLPNADHVRAAPDRVVAHVLPLVRLHAFGARLRRWERSLDSKGFLDAETGLLTGEAFIRDLTRAVEDCGKRSATLSLARFSFERINRHTSLDAARIVGRLVRTTDFACRDEDGSIHVVFGDTDLKAAHVVARRIASVLKHTMLVPGPDAPRLNPQVSLVTRKPSDTAETLLARVHPTTVAAE
jgi:GGDEF domain-containing protein